MAQIPFNRMKRALFFLCFISVATLFAQNDYKQEADLTTYKENKNTYIENSSSDSLNDRAYYTKLLSQSFKYSIKGKPNEGLKLSKKVLEYAIKEGIDSLEARAHNNTYIAWLELKENERAFSHLIKAKDIYLRLNDSSKLIKIYNNIGVFYQRNGSLDKTMIYQKKAMNIAEMIDEKTEIFFLAYNLGFNYGIGKGDYKNAMLFLNKGLKFKDLPNLSQITKASLFLLIGYIKKELQEYDEAHKNFDIGIAICEEYGYLNELQEAYSYKSEVYKAQNDLPFANAYLLRQIKIKDSLRKEEREDLAKGISAKYKQKEHQEKLELVKNEKEVQQKLLAQSNLFNWLFAFLIVVLLFTAYWIHTKNKELKLARDRANRLSKVKSDFYSEISHELRTPLYAIIELSGLLLKENIKEKNKKYIESLKLSGTHLLSLINNVLQLNKVESGELNIEHSTFDLKVLILNIIDSLEYGIKERGNTIKFDYDISIPKLLIGDALKLSQVLINLISNAIKYNNNELIEIIVTQIKPEEKNDKVTVVFKITDSDMVASKEKQLEVFENYYHKHSKSESLYKETGLNLSMVKSGLQVMNSNITIDSEEGNRSSFNFIVQFEEKQGGELSELTYQKQLETIKRYKLLVVDDNKINQLVTKKVLDQLLVVSDVTDSGRKAIALVKENHYDCVLMDLHMPEMDGYETSKRIRLFNKTIPIVALTAAASDSMKNRIVEEKMNGCIVKPFLINDFVTTIIGAIKKQKI